MDFKELYQEVKTKIQVQEWRFELPDFYEFVIPSSEMDALKRILKGYFGEEVDLNKPLGDKQKFIAEKWGGVRKNQIFYFRELPQVQELTFLWPWCDGTRVSAKMIQDKPVDRSKLWSSAQRL